MNRKLFLFTIIVLIYGSVFSQEKRSLTHDCYDDWKGIKNQEISSNGQFVTYEVNPQDGDGLIYLYDVSKDKNDSIPRGTSAAFSANNDVLVFKVVAQKDTVRSCKLAKIKDDDMPKDSLFIWFFKKDSVVKVPRVKSFKVAEEGQNYLVYLKEKDLLEPKDTTITTDSLAVDTGKTEKVEVKSDGTDLIIMNLTSLKTDTFNYVDEYSVSKNGMLVSFISNFKDSVKHTKVYTFNTKTQSLDSVYIAEGESKKLEIDDKGEQLAFIYSADTVKNKTYDLFLHSNNKLTQITDSLTKEFPEGKCLSEYGKIFFSKNGTRLYFGIGENPKPEEKDTLIDDEKVSLDIWSWTDTYLQPQQLKELDKRKKQSYLSVYHIKENKIIVFGDEEIEKIRTYRDGDSDFALGYAEKPYGQLISWISSQYRDIYLVNIKTGEKKLLLEKFAGPASLSPEGKYLAFYQIDKREWMCRNLKTNKDVSLTGNIDVPFYNEDHDTPEQPFPYAFTGWTKGDKAILINDRFDIWMLNPDMKSKPVCVTNSFGRENNIRFYYQKLDKDIYHVETEVDILLKGFNEKTKQEGFYALNIKKKDLRKLIMDDYRFSKPLKAEYSNKIIWRKEDYNTYPDLYLSDLSFSDPHKISNANPQQSLYDFGSIELVKWKNTEGEEREGLLIKPKDFKPGNKYPMLVYFYERYSDLLNRYWTPVPSRSVINFPYYASNGYVVFIPNIRYGTGTPGEDAYRDIISGTDYILSKGFVNEKRIGIQGQSWGGYQVAYLVTKTDKFAAAMAGAPVSNMTSAYGGIRWGSGLSRMMQYEGGQSRLGATLWENRDVYIKNSPVFYADKVNTPLLIMHNDGDGAVPWYQGIEYFVALRRLQKPVWMLNYNGAPHNLKRRADSKDLTVRMQQFFDYYLKDAPAPVWLKKGVKAIDKKTGAGLELIEE